MGLFDQSSNESYTIRRRVAVGLWEVGGNDPNVSRIPSLQDAFHDVANNGVLGIHEVVPAGVGNNSKLSPHDG
jgi:hypothetical protein